MKDARRRGRPSIRRRFLTVARRLLSAVMKRRRRASQLPTLDVEPDRIVFLGDSLTEAGEWGEWFPDAPVLNRGVAGDVSAGVLARLDSAIKAPRAVFLLIGTNDLGFGVPPAEIVDNVCETLAAIDRRAPGTRVYLQSVMPRSADYSSDIRLLNAEYRRLASAARGEVVFVDLWPALADPDGTLRRGFTSDGLHLTGAGYRAWLEVIRPLVASHLHESPR